ncbi:MAG: type II toxin-antitoxin system death-on-curing family toxin [Verrucomicrobia bacterium]|nr:type II toxin-antitoxin system death-on-curing family toxin [Verrucomicrobiota bacterium]
MIHYIQYQYVIEVHDNLIDEYGGRKGILNEGLLRSALEMPKARFDGKDLHRTIFDKTAAYLFHLIKNHPFVDGNKRTASMVALIFFASNSKRGFTIFNDEYQKIILDVAQGIMKKKEIAKFFRHACSQKR